MRSNKGTHLVLLFFLLAGMIPAAGWTETWQVRGLVLERGSRRPLSGALVMVKNRQDLSSTSDAQGRFSLILDQEGYQALRASLGGDNVDTHFVDLRSGRTPPPLTFYLNDPLPQLPAIVVKAQTEKPQPSQQAMPGAEAAKVAGTGGDPLKAMQTLPGVAAASDSSSDPAVRGSGPQDNFYLVDDLPVGYLLHFGDMYSIFNADVVRQFSLYPSAFGPEFFNVTGAILDVRLREPRQDRLGGIVNVNTMESDFLVEGPVNKKQSFYLGARRSYYDFLLPKTGSFGGGVDYLQFPRFYDYQGKYLWRAGNRHVLSLQLSGADDRLAIRIRGDSDIARHDPVLAGDYKGGIHYHGQGLVWTALVGKNAASKLAVGHLVSGFNETMPIGSALATFGMGYYHNEWTLPLGNSHEVMAGGEVITDDIKLDIDAQFDVGSDFEAGEDQTSAPRRRYKNTLATKDTALFLRDRWQVLPHLALVPGGRLSHDDYLGGTYIEPRLTAAWDVTDQTRATAGWGRHHQYPDGIQMIEEFGNRRLTHFRALHATAGVEQQFADGWSVKAEGYRKDFEKIVVPDAVLKFVNGGSGRAAGFEALIKKEKTRRNSGWASVTYARSTRKNDLTGQKIDYKFDQPWIVNLVADRRLNARWSVGGRWRYHSGAPTTPVIGTTTDPSGRVRPVYAAVGSARLPDYHRLDARVERRFTYDTFLMDVYLDIINLYNHINVSGYSYNADYTSRKAVKQLPLMPSFGIKARF